jgi:hypothetical protein
MVRAEDRDEECSAHLLAPEIDLARGGDLRKRGDGTGDHDRRNTEHEQFVITNGLHRPLDFASFDVPHQRSHILCPRELTSIPSRAQYIRN